MRIGGRGAPVRCGLCHEVHGRGLSCPKPKTTEVRAELQKYLEDLEKFETRSRSSSLIVGRSI